MTRRILYAPAMRRLVYLDEKATPEFWDARWKAEGAPVLSSFDREVATVTARHLVAGSHVLEGGCGRAAKVKALADADFSAVGVDFAAESVERARVMYPTLDIQKGDVRALPFPDSHFDGCWSIGVIEHFWDGYDEILTEAHRVIRSGGIFFLTAPWFSPYRQRKAREGGYPTAEFASEPDAFYQFALGREEVSGALKRIGFKLLSWHGFAPEISMREDMDSIRPAVSWLIGSRGALPKRVLRRIVTRSVADYCGHSFMAIARRTP